MLFIQESAVAEGASLTHDGSTQTEAPVGHKSWLDKTLAEVFGSLNVILQVIFGFFVKMLWLAAFIYIVYCLIGLSAEAGTYVSQLVSEKWL